MNTPSFEQTILRFALLGALCHGCSDPAGAPDATPPPDAAAAGDASQGPTDPPMPDDLPLAPGVVAECHVPATHATIQAAVADESCTLILVASGTYVENLVISRGLEIRGPAPPASPAIVDGGSAGTVITVMASTVVELSYLTIQNGVGTDTVGAGIHTSTQLWLRNSAVVMNAGRGIVKQDLAWDGYFDVRVIDSVVADNASIGIWANGGGTLHVQGTELRGNGAGIGVHEGSVRITDGSVIRDHGGNALFSREQLGSWDREIVIADTLIDGNGWGVIAIGSDVTIERTEIVNTAYGPGLKLHHGRGGAHRSIRIADSSVVGNRGGVAITTERHGWAVVPPVRIERSLIANNAGDGTGNGLSVTGEKSDAFVLEIVNTTISGNARGLYASKHWDSPNHSVFLSNVTITNNHAATGTGGGIYARGTFSEPPAFSRGPQVVHLDNSIIAGNTASGLPDDCATVDDAHVETNGFNVLGTVGGCVITGPAGDTVDADPLLGPLADNGGPTLTHALLPGSPALDAGDPAGCADPAGGLLLVDQRGQPRPSGAACDSGGYEAGP